MLARRRKCWELSGRRSGSCEPRSRLQEPVEIPAVTGSPLSAEAAADSWPQVVQTENQWAVNQWTVETRFVQPARSKETPGIRTMPAYPSERCQEPRAGSSVALADSPGVAEHRSSQSLPCHPVVVMWELLVYLR
jgi:hypothetical protein